MELFQPYLDQPVVYAASAMVAFAYLSTLLTRLLDVAHEWALLRAVGTLGALAAAYMTWRQGWQIQVSVVTCALLINSRPRSLVSPYLVGLRLIIAYGMVTVLVLASPVATLLGPEEATEAALHRVMFFGSRVRVAQSPVVHITSPAGLRIDHDSVTVDFGGARLQRSGSSLKGTIWPALSVYGSSIVIRNLTLSDDAWVLLKGSHCVIESLKLSSGKARIVSEQGTKLINVTLPDGVVLSSVSVEREAVQKHSWLAPVGESGPDARSPLWLQFEAQMPILLRVVVPIAHRLGAWGKEGALIGMEMSLRAWAFLRRATRFAAHHGGLAFNDSLCAFTEALDSTTVASAPPQCTVTYPVWHAVVFYSTKLTWAVGMPAVWRAFVAMAEWDAWAAVATVDALVATVQRCHGPAIAAWGVSTQALTLLGGTYAPVVLETGFDWYAEYVAWYVTSQLHVAYVVGAFFFTGLSVALSLLWTGFAAVQLLWSFYTTTSFPSHVAVASLQTIVVSISYYKEVRLRSNRNDANTAGRFASMLASVKWTASAASVVAEDGTALLTYGIAHAAAALIVFGGSFLSFLPLISTLTLHVAFPVVSTWSVLQLFGRAEKKSIWPLVLAARAVFTLLFQWTVGDVVYRLVLEVVTPLLLVVGILLALVFVRRFLPRKTKTE